MFRSIKNILKNRNVKREVKIKTYGNKSFIINNQNTNLYDGPLTDEISSFIFTNGFDSIDSDYSIILHPLFLFKASHFNS